MSRYLFRMGHLLSVGLISVLASQATMANVVGVDTQNFNPTTSGLDFVTVQSSETLQPGVLNFGLFFNYAINTLPNYEDATTQSRNKARDRLLSSDVNFGLGLLPRWDIGISVPAVLSQQVDEDVFKGVFENTGITDIRLNTKVQLAGSKEGGVAVIGTVELPQVENNPFYGASTAPTYNLELAADTTVNKVAMGINLGYRFRNPGNKIPVIPVEPIDDMWIGSIAGSYLFQSIDTKLIGEIFGSSPTKKSTTQTDRELSTAELLVGIKHDWNSDLAIHSGIGTELAHGSFSPDWRIYVGMNFAMGPLWGKETVAKMPQTVPKGTAENIEALPTETVDITTVSGSTQDPSYLENRAPENKELFVVLNINFATGSSKVPLEFRKYIEKFANYLKRPPMYKRIVISGHTDSIGNSDYNLKLSRSRAETVKRAMVEVFGLDASKIQVGGFGEDRPVADNGNYQGRAQNRRVEFYVER